MKKELTKEQKQKKILKKQLNKKRTYIAEQIALGLGFASLLTMFAVGFSAIFKFDGTNKDEAMEKEEKVYSDATFALGLTAAAFAAVGGTMSIVGEDHERESREKEHAYLKRREEEINDQCISRVDLIEHGKQ